MFADNTNLFSSHSNIKDLFNNVNLGLNKIDVWFKANKLSLNEGKTKYTFFRKFRQKDNIPRHDIRAIYAAEYTREKWKK